MKANLLLFIQFVLVGFIFIAVTSCSKSDVSGHITGVVQIPNKIKLATVAKEAKVYIYLKDYTPNSSKEVMPWEAPVRKVVEAHINSLQDHNIPFEFKDVPKGIYRVSVLVDTGRPHVTEGSSNFTAFPGDYTGGTNQNLAVGYGQTVEVVIRDGLYVSIPDGYQAPLYLPD